MLPPPALQVICTNTQLSRPAGILWDKLSPQKLAQIRVLRDLKLRIEQETGQELPTGGGASLLGGSQGMPHAVLAVLAVPHALHWCTVTGLLYTSKGAVWLLVFLKSYVARYTLLHVPQAALLLTAARARMPAEQLGDCTSDHGALEAAPSTLITLGYISQNRPKQVDLSWSVPLPQPTACAAAAAGCRS
jgi:hypothetical protein